ncbi:MAG: hypothetical protein FD149_591 [Rhodospirillaceae bacterium]|nr:MAG: hypothetical protein FD149_591 [Rhodospirillaceae bacterium]
MRRIIYYRGGIVVDFVLADTLYEGFARTLKAEKHNDDQELNRACRILETYVQRETWHYFNTHADADHHIEGDVMIVDLDGTGTTIEYVSAAEVQLNPW